MRNIALDIFRKRFLLEGYFTIDTDESVLEDFFSFITSSLMLKAHGRPLVHTTSDYCKQQRVHDAFAPLIDSRIYISVWPDQQFLSMIIYTCKDFDETKAAFLTREFFEMTYSEQQIF